VSGEAEKAEKALQRGSHGAIPLSAESASWFRIQLVVLWWLIQSAIKKPWLRRADMGALQG